MTEPCWLPRPARIPTRRARELRAGARDDGESPEAYESRRRPHRRRQSSRPDHALAHHPARAARGVALVFIVACSTVANLILARSVRQKGARGRAALVGTGALRRTLLVESLLLCGAGAVLAIVIARPMVSVSRAAALFRARTTFGRPRAYSGLASSEVAAAVLLACLRLPSAEAANGLGFVERQRPHHHQAIVACACSPSRRSRRRSCCSRAPGC